MSVSYARLGNRVGGSEIVGVHQLKRSAYEKGDSFSRSAPTRELLVVARS